MKKIFGMSIPTFGRSSASLASTGAGKTDSVPATPKRTQPSELPIAPTLSIKASRVLGARPSTSLAVPKKPGRPTPRSGRSPPRGSPPRRSPPRSQSSKSLPTTGLQEQNKFTARRPQYNVSMPRRRRSPSRKNGVGRDTYYEYDINQRYSSSPMSTGPPTPPRKDTPKEKKVKEQVAEKQVQAHPEKENKNIQMPNFLTVAKPGPVSSEGGKSPAKYCPLTAADYAKLIEQPPLPSARATISNAAIELEGDTLTSQFKADDEEQKQKYPGWWREERQKRYLTINDDTLPPTFYSPSVWSARLFDGRPSHNVSAPYPHY